MCLIAGLALAALLATPSPGRAQSTLPDGTGSNPTLPSDAQAVVGTVEILRSFPALGHDPRGVEVTGGKGWSTSANEHRIYRFDPATGVGLSQFSIPSQFAADLAYDGTALWVSDPALHVIHRVDPDNGTLLRTLPAPGPCGNNGLAWDGNALWVSEYCSNRVYRVDADNGAVLQSFPVPASGLTYGLAWDGAFLYLANAYARCIFMFDPVSGALLATFDVPFAYPSGLSFDGQAFWFMDFERDRIYQVRLDGPTRVAKRSFGALKASYH